MDRGAKTSKPMKVEGFVCSSCGTSLVLRTGPRTGAARTMTKKV